MTELKDAFTPKTIGAWLRLIVFLGLLLGLGRSIVRFGLLGPHRLEMMGLILVGLFLTFAAGCGLLSLFEAFRKAPDMREEDL